MLTDRTANLELITVFEIAKILSGTVDFKKAAGDALHVLHVHLELETCVFGIGTRADTLAVLAEAGNPDTPERPVLTGRSGALVRQVFQTGSAAVFVGPRHERPDGSADASVLTLTPVRGTDGVFGLIGAARTSGPEEANRSERDLRLLALVAVLFSQAYRLNRTIAEEREFLIQEKHRLEKQLKPDYDVENVIGKSPRMKEVFADVHQAAKTQATVLLRGESGTGKEAIAHAIHTLSSRSRGPFIKVNCAALPETLLESELFGHVKGAFTGATGDRKGRFEMAEGGTLFLDEIGDISAAFQAKLLRVLQEHEFERVGGNKTIKGNFRLVAATNRNLEEMVQKDGFRADLYFRLNVVTIFLPALRERREDIPLLVDSFLTRFNRENDRHVGIDPLAIDVLLRCNWPGNVRELENCIERTATMARGDTISARDLRCAKGQCFSSALEAVSSRFCTPSPASPPYRPTEHLSPPVPDEPKEPAYAAPDLTAPASEKERLLAAMEKCGWVQAKAARLLNQTPRQVGYALRKYNIPLKKL